MLVFFCHIGKHCASTAISKSDSYDRADEFDNKCPTRMIAARLRYERKRHKRKDRDIPPPPSEAGFLRRSQGELSRPEDSGRVSGVQAAALKGYVANPNVPSVEGKVSIAERRYAGVLAQSYVHYV